ncbi:MAG: hypothetical protein A4E49_00643 [Methanosaeta sp. PtaU1.Bin112]|nr:MAG: hypothetical protein A4E49_00643 [Methanosaeta sp. PtaU1.Bin112]
MTRSDVYGRGNQKGVVVGGENYDMLKTVLMLVVESDCVAAVVKENIWQKEMC